MIAINAAAINSILDETTKFMIKVSQDSRIMLYCGQICNEETETDENHCPAPIWELKQEPLKEHSHKKGYSFSHQNV